MKADALADYLKSEPGLANSPEVVGAALESLHEMDTNDGRVIALASQDSHGGWKALKV